MTWALKLRWISLPFAALLATGIVLLLVNSAPAAVTCDVSWDHGAATQNWFDAANWTNDTLPAAGQGVCIGSGQGTIVFGSGASASIGAIAAQSPLSLQSGTLTLTSTTSDSSFSALSVSGGVIDGAGNFATDTMTWSAGTLQGTGTATINHNAANTYDLDMSGSGSRNLLRPMVLAASTTAELAGAGGYLYLQSTPSGTGSLDLSGTLEMRNDLPIYSYVQGGSATTSIHVESGATLVKKTASGTATVDPALDNDGTVSSEQGTLNLTNGAGATEDGNFAASSGATLAFAGGSHVLGSASQVTGAGTIAFTGGTFSLPASATYSVSHTSISGGTNTFSGAITPGALAVSGGATSFNGTTNPTSLALSGGTIDGSGSMATDTMTWSAGTLQGTGTLTVNHNAANTYDLDMTGGGSRTLLRTLTLSAGATSELAGGGGYLYLQSTSAGTGFFDLAGTLEMRNDLPIYSYIQGGFPTTSLHVESGATLVKKTSAGTATVDPALDNDGTVSSELGTLNLNNGAGATESGNFLVSSGATLAFTGGNHVLGASSSLTGAGTFAFTGGTFSLPATGTYSAGATAISGGTNTFQGTITPGPMTVSGGASTFNGTTNPTSLALSGGTIDGSGSMATDTMTWSAGTLQGTGTLTVNHNAANTYDLDMTGGGSRTLLRTLTLSAGATSELAGGGGYLYLQSTAAGTGLFDIAGSFEMRNDLPVYSYVQGGFPTTLVHVESGGSLTKKTAAGSATIDPALDNDGSVASQQGTLSLGNGAGATESGNFAVSSGATLAFAGGNHLLGASSQVTGAGTIAFTGGSFNLPATGTYSPGATTISGGTNTFQGTITPGPTTVSGGTSTFNGTTNPTSLAFSGGTIDGSGSMTTDTMTWSGGTLQGTGTTTINHNAANTYDLDMTGSSSRVLQRTLTLSAGATSEVAGGGGYLYLQSTPVGTGLFDVAGSLELRNDLPVYNYVQGGYPSTLVHVESGATVTKKTGPGTTTFDPALDNDGTVSVEQGTLNLTNGAGATESGNFAASSGATLAFAGGNHVLGAASQVTGLGTFAFTGGTFSLPASGTYSAGATAISGGTNTFQGAVTPGAMTVSGGSSTFNGATNPASLAFSGGTIDGSGSMTTDTMTWSGGTLQGTGTTTVNHNAANTYDLDVTGAGGRALLRTLALAAGATGELAGSGYLQLQSTAAGTGLFNVAGTFELRNDIPVYNYVQGGFPQTQLHVQSGGTLSKPAGAGITTVDPQMQNDGTVSAAAATLQLTNLLNYNATSHTLTGGRFNISSTLVIPSGDIQHNASTLDLDGANWAFKDGTGFAPNDVLRNLGDNAAAGELILSNGAAATIPASGTLTNSGTVTLGSGTNLTDTAFSNASGGLLRGVGTVTAPVSNGGTVSPGMSPGLLTVAGDYTQTAAGSLAIELNGSTTAGQDYDQLHVTGNSTLDGTLALTQNYTPTLGESFTVVQTDGTQTGKFATVTGDALPNNSFLSPAYNPHSVVVTAVGEPSASINNVSVTEGDTGTKNMSFTVTLSNTTTKDVTIHYTTADGTATAGSDYTARSGDLVIPAGSTSGQINVPIIGDTTIEPNETLTVTLSSPQNATLGTAVGTGTITNDDFPSASIDDVSVTEGNSGTTNATFTVTLSQAGVSAATVDFATADGTANAGSDYQATSGTLHFAAGETSKTISVPVNGDTTVEPDETFTVTLSNPSAMTIAHATGTGTIVNDDQPPAPQPAPAPAPPPAPTTLPSKGCVKIGAFQYRFTVPLKKVLNGKKVNRRSRVKLVVYTLDGKQIGRVTKRPFQVAIDGRTLTPGKHVLLAKVTLQVPGTKKVFKRTYTVTFNACS